MIGDAGAWPMIGDDEHGERGDDELARRWPYELAMRFKIVTAPRIAMLHGDEPFSAIGIRLYFNAAQIAAQWRYGMATKTRICGYMAIAMPMKKRI